MRPSAHTSYHLSDAGFPPWHRFGVMKRVGKVQNPNSFGWDLFSFPLITKQLLTDSKHGPTQKQCFRSVSGWVDRQTGWEKKGRRWGGKKNGKNEMVHKDVWPKVQASPTRRDKHQVMLSSKIIERLRNYHLHLKPNYQWLKTKYGWPASTGFPIRCCFWQNNPCLYWEGTWLR